MKDMEFDLTKPHCYYFNEIAKIPHGSKNEKRLSDWIVDFAKAHGLRYVQDDMYNVVIYKDATKGYEDHPGVIVQAHIDMVCEKTPESTHNFETDPLDSPKPGVRRIQFAVIHPFHDGVEQSHRCILLDVYLAVQRHDQLKSTRHCCIICLRQVCFHGSYILPQAFGFS